MYLSGKITASAAAGRKGCGLSQQTLSWLLSADVGFGLALLGHVHHGDVRTHGTELAYQILIAALDILDTAQLGGALGGQTGDDQRRRSQA